MYDLFILTVVGVFNTHNLSLVSSPPNIATTMDTISFAKTSGKTCAARTISAQTRITFATLLDPRNVPPTFVVVL